MFLLDGASVEAPFLNDLNNFFASIFGVLTVVCGITYYLSRQKAEKTSSISLETQPTTPEKQAQFTKFQVNYLVVYIIVMASDWLQGPYVYALYASYGFSKAEIGELFIAGFSSSLVFGTIAGGVADKVGRKTMCIAFGIIYIGSCITKLFPDYWILMLGRLLGGIATSLLFSSFESWMVDEHKKQGFDLSLLAGTFHLATLGNGLIAILSGLVASFTAANYGYVSPFMVAIGCLIVSSLVVSFTWNENYGDSKIEIIQTFTNAIKAVASDKKILILGAMQSLFEAAMYTFVFMWSFLS